MDLVARFAARPDYHQLPSYAKVMEEIGWQTVKLKGCQLFVKPIGPVAFAKLQRPGQVDFKELRQVQKARRIFRLIVEPGVGMDPDGAAEAGFKPTDSHFAYTKTLIVDLSGTEVEILKSFSKTTAYQMRRSQKMGVEYRNVAYKDLTQSLKEEILCLHGEWEKEKQVSGYEDSFLLAMWKYMREGTMILAYKGGKLQGVLFLLIHHKLGMYFYQFSTRAAREKLYIPSGLAYEAIKLCKTRGCDLFDLCSAYDERYPKENLKWQGFSIYKERFHPIPIYYPQSFMRHSLPFLG